MWATLAFLCFAGGLLLHLWWHRRFQETEQEIALLQEKLIRFQEEQQRSTAQDLARQQTLFNSMVEGVLLLDPNGRIQLVNQALTHLMGVSDDITGQTILEAFRLNELMELVQQAAAGRPVLDFELELAGPGKRSLQVNAAAIPGQDCDHHGVILVFHDLTRLKQLENTRKEFVANVSHELRTPLSLIKGYVETLIDGAKDDPAVAARFLQTIVKHTDRLTYLIEDLLTISQLESGQSVMNLQHVELKPIVLRVFEDLQSRAQYRNTQLKNEVSGEISVNADADRIEQVVFNLVDNAIKYGRSEGTVVVAARLMENGAAEVSVQDDGPGIPPEALGRVFERFYRVDRARSREQGGTGLGLSIVKHIVQSHGGEVWAKSELGRGTTFFFTLPQAGPVPQAS